MSDLALSAIQWVFICLNKENWVSNFFDVFIDVRGS